MHASQGRLLPGSHSMYVVSVVVDLAAGQPLCEELLRSIGVRMGRLCVRASTRITNHREDDQHPERDHHREDHERVAPPIHAVGVPEHHRRASALRQIRRSSGSPRHRD
ncbi:hypothetical protein, partial [Prescottella equi]|uniref:hypothetical protein n=1 Tax=Rhodococcus hoagii TaxID=43767 RepID=UPI001F465F8C